jgi:hypothetical protein
VEDGSRGGELIAGGILRWCSYPRLDCVGEEGKEARVGGEGEVHDQIGSLASSVGPLLIHSKRRLHSRS